MYQPVTTHVHFAHFDICSPAHHVELVCCRGSGTRYSLETAAEGDEMVGGDILEGVILRLGVKTHIPCRAVIVGSLCTVHFCPSELTAATLDQERIVEPAIHGLTLDEVFLMVFHHEVVGWETESPTPVIHRNKPVLTHGLINQGIADEHNLCAVPVFWACPSTGLKMGTVKSVFVYPDIILRIGPGKSAESPMGAIVCRSDDQIITVLPKAEHLVGMLACPVTIHTGTQWRLIPSTPYRDGASANAVVHLVHARTSPLTHIRTHAHVPAIAAVCRGCAWAVNT